MIASEKSHNNLSDWKDFLFKKRYEDMKNWTDLSSEKWEILVGNRIYDYAHSFFAEDF